MDLAAVAFVSLLLALVFAGLRVRYAVAQSTSSTLFITMLSCPFVVYLYIVLGEVVSSRGSGLAGPVVMGVSLGVACAGLVGLTFNGLARLLMRAKTKDNKGSRALLRGAAGAFLVAGTVLAYFIWPIGGAAFAAGEFAVARMVASAGVAAWFVYVGSLLWV